MLVTEMIKFIEMNTKPKTYRPVRIKLSIGISYFSQLTAVMHRYNFFSHTVTLKGWWKTL